MGMSTFSPSSFGSETLSWDVGVYSEYHNDQDDNEILTALVRKSYLKHLQRSLFQNYNLWRQCNSDNEDFQYGKSEILRCASMLENKALRACMVASYYQRVMNKTMKEIKSSTEEGSLFSPLVEQLYEVAPPVARSDKEDKETQTNITLMTSPEPAAEARSVEHDFKSPPSQPKRIQSAGRVSASPASTGHLDFPQLPPPRASFESDDLEDLITILMSSPNFPQPEEQDTKEEENINSTNVPQKRKYSETFDHYTDSQISLQQECTMNNIPVGVIEEEKPKQKLDERLAKLASLFGDIGDEDPDPKIVNTDETSQNVNKTHQENQVLVRVRPPSDWQAELVAQSCHLKSLLQQLSPERKIIVVKRFKDLFGSEKIHHLEISCNEEAMCRKRTANLVVAELTPYYINGKIASRDLFKLLAKKMTDRVLLLSTIADQTLVNDMVRGFFENGKKVISEADVG